MKKRILFCFVFLLNFSLFCEGWAIVFSGGGGKGAYELGVFKAFYERGIIAKTVAISGASVGALNAALFVCEGVQKSQDIWTNSVLEYLTRDEELISQEGLSQLIDGVDVSLLKNAKSPILYAVAVRNRLSILKRLTSYPGRYAHYFRLGDFSEDEIRQILLASSAFPFVTNPVRLHDGFDYIDGGDENAGGDNTPIAPIAELHKNVSRIAVVYLEHKPSRRIRAIDYDEFELIEIIPSIDLGKLFEGTVVFSRERIELLIRQGYEDASTILERKGFYKIAPWFF